MKEQQRWKKTQNYQVKLHALPLSLVLLDLLHMQWIPLQSSKHTQVLSTCRFPLKRTSPKRTRGRKQKARSKARTRQMKEKEMQQIVPRFNPFFFSQSSDSHSTRCNSPPFSTTWTSKQKKTPFRTRNNNGKKVHKTKCLLACHFKTRAFPIFLSNQVNTSCPARLPLSSSHEWKRQP